MYKRYIEDEVAAHMKIMPVVLITGARQSGKTTLVEAMAKKRKCACFTFDDETTLTNAKRDPYGWISALPKPVVIDEIQRVPEVFLAIKRDVDQNRTPGRFLLTGSANPLLSPKLGDSLAGRMGIVSMFPFAISELNEKPSTFIDDLFADTMPFNHYGSLPSQELIDIIVRGGFPPVQPFESEDDICRWIRSYLQSMMERDVRDIANIEGLREFPRLFWMLAQRSGAILNQSELSRSLGMVHMTLKRYMRLLETLYFIYLVPGWYTNHGKRLTKSSKVYVLDTAILSCLLDVNSEKLIAKPDVLGPFIETFVFNELMKLQSWSKKPFKIYHYREKDFEVDFVLEQPDGTIIGIEVKSTQTIKSDDLRGLKRLKAAAKGNFKRGIILHQGNQVEPLAADMIAMPIQALWASK